MRHAFATLNLDAGASLRDAMGHASPPSSISATAAGVVVVVITAAGVVVVVITAAGVVVVLQPLDTSLELGLSRAGRLGDLSAEAGGSEPAA
jgi:hypothetical protein